MPTTTENRLTMDLEQRLQEDTGGELKKELQDEFARQISGIEGRLKQGVAPDEYARLDTVKQGLQSASVILERLWLHYHN
jgi:hypothetical protein